MSKLIRACIALAAFAAFAAVPTVASASPELTSPAGTTVAVGAGIQATNEGHTLMTTPIGNVTCDHAFMTGTVTSNTGSHVAGNITTAHFRGPTAGSACSGPLGPVTVTTDFEGVGVPWCITASGNKHEFTVRGGLCSQAARALKFTLHTAGLVCKYEKATLTGTHNTAPNQATLTTTGQNFTKYSGSIFCPGSGVLDMSFVLSTDPGGAAVLIS